MTNKNEDLIECVSIRGVIVDLRDVSPELESRYRRAIKALGKVERANDELTKVCELILMEQAPALAFKSAMPRPQNAIEALRKRTLAEK